MKLEAFCPPQRENLMAHHVAMDGHGYIFLHRMPAQSLDDLISSPPQSGLLAHASAFLCTGSGACSSVTSYSPPAPHPPALN